MFLCCSSTLCVRVRVHISRVDHVVRITVDDVHSREPLLSSTGISYCLSVCEHKPARTCTDTSCVCTHTREKEAITHLVPVRCFIDVRILAVRLRIIF